MTLASLHQQGWSMRCMAQLLGRSPSTISRELRRNVCAGSYASAPAQRMCHQRRLASRPLPKLHSQGCLWFVVSTMLTWRWSPQQIARTLRRMHPQDSSLHISHESIYTACCASSCPRVRTWACMTRRHWTPLPTWWTTGHDRPWTGIALPGVSEIRGCHRRKKQRYHSLSINQWCCTSLLRPPSPIPILARVCAISWPCRPGLPKRSMASKFGLNHASAPAP